MSSQLLSVQNIDSVASPAFSDEEIKMAADSWSGVGPESVRSRPVESGVGKILSGVAVAKPSQALEQTHQKKDRKTTCKDEAKHAETWRRVYPHDATGTTALRAFP